MQSAAGTVPAEQPCHCDCAAGTLCFKSRLNWNVSFQSCIHLRDWKRKSEAIQVFESSSDERNLRTSYSLPTHSVQIYRKGSFCPFLCTFPMCCLKCMGSLSITVLSEASLWRAEQAELWWIMVNYLSPLTDLQEDELCLQLSVHFLCANDRKL